MEQESWIQSVNPSHVTSLAEALDKIIPKLTKEDVGLELVEIEHAARLVMEEEEDGDEEAVSGLSKQMEKVSIAKKPTETAHDSDDDTTESESSDSSSSDTDSDDSSSEDDA